VTARFDDKNGLAPGDRLGRPGDISLGAAPDLEQYLTRPRLPARTGQGSDPTSVSYISTKLVSCESVSTASASAMALR